MTNTFNRYQYDDLKNRENDPYAKAKYDLLLKYLRKRSKDKLNILNAGCGSGDLSILLAREGHKVLGIDPSSEYIDLARKRAFAFGVDCRFEVGSIEELSPEKYDCVIATDVLEHIADDYAAMKKLYEVTNDNGFIIITVPALQALFGYHDEQLGHFRRYNKSNLKKLAFSAGKLKLKKLRYFGFTLIPICYLFSCLLHRPYPSGGVEKNLKTKLISWILDILLKIDSIIAMPLGTSLICIIKK